LYAKTVTTGDPTWAGPLAGSELGLPVYHITEAEVSQQVDPAVYAVEVGLAEMALDVDEIGAAARGVRDSAA
jgi:betaine reductase